MFVFVPWKTSILHPVKKLKIPLDLQVPLNCILFLCAVKGMGKMQEITVDKEFRDLIPNLDESTYKMLEGSLLEQGCRDALILWNGLLIDGHHRYEICAKHDIPFKTVDKDFDSREEAMIWIICSQVSRRNLTPVQLTYYRGVHYRMEKKIQGQNRQKSKNRQNGAVDKVQKICGN